MTATNFNAQKTALPGTLLILFLFSSLYLGTNFAFDLGIIITPSDLTILAFLIFLPVIKQFKFRLNKHVLILFALIFISFLLETISALLRDLPQNLTLGIALLRNGALIFLILQVNYDYKKLSKWIVLSGVFFSIIAIAGFVNSLLNYRKIIFNQNLWDPGIFYTLDQGILRLQGLKEDPNFFFIINLIPLFFSISLIREKRNFFSISMFSIILTASFLTFSRTGMVLLGLLLIIIILKEFNLKKIFLTSVIILTIIFLSTFISNIFSVPSITKVITFRFEKAVETGGSHRIYYWEVAWKGFENSIIFGNGGRYTLRKAGNYAHNDYLEMLSSHGLMGFGLMSILYLYVFLFIKTKYKLFRENYLFTSSSQLFVFMLIASFFFTIYYSPSIWFSVALIFSARDKTC